MNSRIFPFVRLTFVPVLSSHCVTYCSSTIKPRSERICVLLILLVPEKYFKFYNSQKLLSSAPRMKFVLISVIHSQLLPKSDVTKRLNNKIPKTPEICRPWRTTTLQNRHVLLLWFLGLLNLESSVSWKVPAVISVPHCTKHSRNYRNLTLSRPFVHYLFR